MQPNHNQNGENQGAEYHMNISQLKDVLKIYVKQRQPTMVWSGPGVGKSEAAQQVAADLGYQYYDIRALQTDPVDLRGIPQINEFGQTSWAPPADFPPQASEDNYLVNLEELPSALPAVQVSMYQLIRDRRIGQYYLPPGAALIACGNRISDRGVVHRMPTPLASRFVHLTVEPDPSEWTRWAAENGLAPEVIFFIRFKPENLYQFNPQSEEIAFACPRTWEFVANTVRNRDLMSPEVEKAIYRGTVGTGPGMEFYAFLQVWRELPDPKTVIDNPENALVPSSPDTVIALCGALYKMADGVNFSSIAAYAKRLEPELGEFLVGSCVRRNPELKNTGTYATWITTSQI